MWEACWTAQDVASALQKRGFASGVMCEIDDASVWRKIPLGGLPDLLLTDDDDLVRKGYGWLLKEESRCHQQEVFDYVIKNKAIMPRTALRYAIELMSPELKAAAMTR